MDGYTKTRNNRKTQKSNNLPKTNKIVIPKYKLDGGLDFTFSLPRGRFIPLPRKLRLWSRAFQKRTATSSFAWLTRNNRYDSANAAYVLWVWRKYCWYATWPTVILRFMETSWKTLTLSPRNLISWIKLNFTNN